METLSIKPYRQTIWFMNPLTSIVQGNSFHTDAYVGAAYEIVLGEGFVSYEDWAGNFWTNVWDNLMGTGTGWSYYLDAKNYYDGNTPSNNEDVDTSSYYEDSTLRFNMIDNLPANV
jgi:hypothetical protein